GTGYITDVGMTGPYDGILGVDKEAVMKRFVTSLPVRFEVEKKGRTQLNGVLVTIDKKTGNAKKIERIIINDDHPFFNYVSLFEFLELLVHNKVISHHLQEYSSSRTTLANEGGTSNGRIKSFSKIKS